MIRLMSSYPKQLTIGENVWDVVFCRRIPDEPSNIVGLTDPSEFTIYIKMGQTPEDRFKTFAHEVCHAVCFEYGIKENHSIIYGLEEPILRFFIDNGLVL